MILNKRYEKGKKRVFSLLLIIIFRQKIVRKKHNLKLQQSMRNYSYLTPSSKIHKQSASKSYLFEKSVSEINGVSPKYRRRKIFEVGKDMYEDYEKDAIQKISEYFKNKNPPKHYPDALLLKYCYLGKFSTADSVDKMKYYEEWHAIPECSKNKQTGIIHSGVFYCYGRDESYCPTIYFHPSKLDLKQFSVNDYLACLRMLLKPIENHMLMPGRVEEWNIVVDLRGWEQKKVNELYDIGVVNLKKIILAYPYRMKNVLVIENPRWKKWERWGADPSPSTAFIKNLIVELNVSGLERRVHMIKHLKDLNKYISPEERQQCYGGTLENLSEFWPIQTTNKFLQVNSQFHDQSGLQSVQYYSVDNDENKRFFLQQDQTSFKCDLKNCTIF